MPYEPSKTSSTTSSSITFPVGTTRGGGDELAKIASGRITVPPNVFAWDVTKPYVNLEPTP
jgi:hypothetical protein